MKYPLLAQKKMPLAIPWQLLMQVFLSFSLSAAQLSRSYAPFALAYIAAAGAGIRGIACLLGTAAGALVFFDFQPGLRFVASAILIFSANIAFCDSKLTERKLFLPCISAGAVALVQSVYLVGRSADQWALCAAALAITALAASLLRILPQQTIRYLLLACVLLGISRFTPISTFSPGRALLAFLLLRVSFDNEPANSALLGAGAGFLLDLTSSPPQLLFTAILTISCAAASLCKRQSRWLVGIAFSLPFAVLPVLFGVGIPGDYICEALLSALLYYIIPSRFLTIPHLKALAPPVSPSFRTCLAQSAAAFRDLYDSFFRGTQPPPQENPSVLFDRAAQQVCRSCVLCSSCWQEHYNTLFAAFHSACPKLLHRGQALPQDFPPEFSSRCVHFPELLRAINEELRAFLLRRQYHQRLLAAQQQAREQYAQLGDLLASADSNQAVPAVIQPLGYRIGSALRPKEGEQVCGDQLAVFEVGSTLYLLLSDGMGSGEAAHREAAMTVRLLQQFLKAGIDATPALKTLNTALTLRGESGGGFTTIDLLALHRGSGEAVLYKYGAAPSYLKKTGCVTRISGQSMPAGLQNSADTPECTHLSLPSGSFMLMISDGIADSTDDEWLQDLLAGWTGSDANALVSLILSESRSRKGLSDDCAILLLQLPESDLGRAQPV